MEYELTPLLRDTLGPDAPFVGSQEELLIWFEKQKTTLKDRTIASVRERFKDWGHSPSEDHWKGLAEIADVYQSMATGTCKPSRFMSSLPPGMGKTTVAIKATKALLRDGDFKDVGVIYFLSRLEEIKTLIEAMGLERDSVGVLTSDPEINALGNPIPEKARVLFTTQQRLEAFSKDGTAFGDMKELRYKGQPRAVRIWDEAILPSMTLTVNAYTLASLPKGLGAIKPKLAGEIFSFAASLKDSDGQRITMLDIDREHIDLEDFKSFFSSQEDKDTAEALWYLSGRVVRVRKEGVNGSTSLDYEDILPPDLAPMLILDASGGLRKTYGFWKDHRGGLELLHSPQKSYRGLAIHHLNKGAGKTKQRNPKSLSQIADWVSQMIGEIPEGEEILVVHHKARPRGPDIVREIQHRIGRRKESVQFCNWGRHTATNQFGHIRYVILAGILEYNLAQYEAAGRAAKKASVEDDFSEQDFVETRIGEISHHIFQAAGRGSIRKTVDGGCPEGCNLYLIFSTHKKTGYPRDHLSEVFPEATVLDWGSDVAPVRRELTGKVRQAFEFVTGVLAGDPTSQLSTAEVRGALEMNRQNWSNNVLNHPAFLPSLEAAGIFHTTEKGKAGTFHLGP